MRILKVQNTPEEDLDEEDYEENEIPVNDETVCRVLNLIFPDKKYFATIIDQDTDSLSNLRLYLSPNRKGSLKLKDSVLVLASQKLRFSFINDYKLIVIPLELESSSIKSLIEHYQIKHLIVSETLTVYIYEEERKEDIAPPDPNELFRESITLIYELDRRRQKKIIVGKLLPKPQILILSSKGEEETQIKIKDSIFESLNDASIAFSSKLNLYSLNFIIEFSAPDKKSRVLSLIDTIYSKLALPATPTSSISRHYFVKKVNRFGVKQKRIIWFDFSNSSFHISTVENKNHKNFSIKLIKKFVKKSPNSMIVAFYEEVEAKKLDIVFFSEAEMNEYLDIAQRIQQGLSESKFQSKQSVIFTEDIGNKRESRRHTWLNKIVTKATTGKNSNHHFVYNVLSVGLVTDEKRYLVFDIDSQEISIETRQEKTVKKMLVQNISIQSYLPHPTHIEILSIKSSYLLVFPSVYQKYHFCSHFYLLKFPQQIIQSDRIRNRHVSIYTSTWNIGQKAEPSQSTLEKFLSNSENHEIIAIGFQECKRSKFNQWLTALNLYYAERNRVLLSYISMWDMFLVVYIDALQIDNVSEVKTLTKATGVANIIGNKGGVLLQFRVEDTSFCFVSCHLAARFNRLLIRNQNSKDLLALRPTESNLEYTIESDYTFYIGDFNYRIEEDFYQAIQMIDVKDYRNLWPKDQMLQQMRENRMYSTFNEGVLNFKPTYRLIPNRDEWSNKREQTPSWTDRILYKNNRPIVLNVYQCLDDCYGSDHRPIFATFTAEIRSWFIPQSLPPLSDDIKLGIIEFQYLEVQYTEETLATHAMISFVSPYIENQPKSSQVLINSEGRIELPGDKLPMISFIFSSPEFLTHNRLVIALWMISVSGEGELVANASIGLNGVIEFIRSSYRVDHMVSFNTDKCVSLEQNLEFGSRIVGVVKGTWTYNICSRSEQNRF